MSVQEIREEEQVYIDQEGISFLNEILGMCKYSTKKQKDVFWKAVLKTSQATSVKEIKLDNFEVAIIKAKELLAIEGARVFSKNVSKSGIKAYAIRNYYQTQNVGGQYE